MSYTPISQIIVKFNNVKDLIIDFGLILQFFRNTYLVKQGQAM